MLQSLRQMPAEWVIDKFLFLLLFDGDYITLFFSAHRLLYLCSALSKVCMFCNLNKEMADAVENLMKHLQLAIGQFKILVELPFEGHVDVDQIEGLVIDICTHDI